ncbi:hypothetical protein ES703_39589 [subsurface metagenome]
MGRSSKNTKGGVLKLAHYTREPEFGEAFLCRQSDLEKIDFQRSKSRGLTTYREEQLKKTGRYKCLKKKTGIFSFCFPLS